MKNLIKILCLFSLLATSQAWAVAALDGSANVQAASGTSTTVTLTTTTANDVIILHGLVNTGAGVAASSITSAHVTWTQRVSGTATNGMFEWYGVASTVLTSEVITVNFTASQTFANVVAFGIKGANTSSIFDPNGSLPVLVTGSSQPDPTYSTTNSNSFVVGILRFSGTGSPTSGAGYTTILGASFILDQYALKASPQGGATFSTTTGNGDINGGLVDAINSAPTLGTAPFVNQYSVPQWLTVTATPATLSAEQNALILCDATAGNVSIPLPTALNNFNFYGVKKVDATANTCTFTTTASQTIDGTTPAAISTQNGIQIVNSDNSNWSTRQISTNAPLLVTSPISGQTLVYNGTNFVNSGTQCAEITANTTLSPTTPCVNVTTAGTVTVTLPTAVGSQLCYTVSMDASSTGTLTLATTSSQTINKAAAPGPATYRAGWSYDLCPNNANYTIH